MPSFIAIASIFVVALGLFVAYLYVFGIPPETKHKLEETVLKSMGENKASHMLKNAIHNQIPASDQKDVREVKASLGNVAGEALNNPLGKMTGNAADDGTRPVTGR